MLQPLGVGLRAHVTSRGFAATRNDGMCERGRYNEEEFYETQQRKDAVEVEL